ncbi:MAG: transcriptional regulator, GntR family [Acidimicrobiaceae bacterium]|nr:transcriptional regulator, GntR family [Acidimicrobiaceae bacterium]
MPARQQLRAQGDLKERPLESALTARHDRSKITHWVYDELKAAIIDLRLAPGEPLREAAIAESLGVSKTPVREALGRLEQEGLVEAMSFKGAVVSSYSRRDLVDLYELRELLEVRALREAAASMTDEDLARLDTLIADGERLRSAKRVKQLEVVIDSFDAILYEQVTNRRISVLIDNLRAHLTRIGRLTTEIPGRLYQSVDEHARIADALKARDADAAEVALREHIASVRDAQLKALEGQGFGS